MGCACLSSQSGAMCVWTQPLQPHSPMLTEVISSAELIGILADRIAPAVPDFKWGASTDGSKDDSGRSLVAVQVSAEIRANAIVSCLPVQRCSMACCLRSERAAESWLPDHCLFRWRTTGAGLPLPVT